jgi:hypothetical protein
VNVLDHCPCILRLFLVARKTGEGTSCRTRANRLATLTSVLGVERAGSPSDSACTVHRPHSSSIAGSGFPLVHRFCDHRGFAFPAARSEMALSRLGSEFSCTGSDCGRTASLWRGHVSVGSNSEVGARNRHVRYSADSDQTADIARGPVRATSGLMHRSKRENPIRSPRRL